MAEVYAGFTSCPRCSVPSSSSFSCSSYPRRPTRTFTPASASTVGSTRSNLSSADRALAGILDSGIIACLRAPSADSAMNAAQAALDGGITVLEIVMTTPGALEVVDKLRHKYMSAVIGVGTILSIEDARSAMNAGASFFMSPATVKEVIFGIEGEDILYIPGAMTPTEVFDAHKLGAKIVKIYPASVLGGSQYISVLKKPFSHIPVVASQGVTIDSINAYIESGASAVVLSDAIFSKEAVAQRNYKEIYRLATLASERGSKAVKR